MELNRRDFGKWLSLACASLIVPKIALADVPIIESAIVTTNFRLENVFENMQMSAYSYIETVPQIDLIINYSDGSVKQFETNDKIWMDCKYLEKSECILNEKERTFQLSYMGTVCKLSNLRLTSYTELTELKGKREA